MCCACVLAKKERQLLASDSTVLTFNYAVHGNHVRSSGQEGEGGGAAPNMRVMNLT